MKQDISQALFKRASSIFPGGVNSPVRAFRSVERDPFFVDRGEGAYLYDVDGNRYVDFVGSWGPLVLGHAHPEVVEALQQQLVRGTSYGACSEREIELATLIQEQLPSLEMLRFVNSGTEAGLSVIRLARGYTGRSKIIKFAGCYHGHVDALLTQAGSGVATLGLPDSRGIPEVSVQDTITVPYNDIAAVEAVFDKFPDEIAAIIIEPVVGNAGMILPEDGFHQQLRSLCDRNNSLLIFDEVMTGFRVSPKGAQGLFDIVPDLTMLGKVIGGGLPVGAYGGRRNIMELIAPAGPVYQAGTLSGNPLAMAAGIATLGVWLKEGVFEAATECASDLAATFRSAAKAKDIPLHAVSCGSMFGFFFREGPVLNYAAAKQSDTKRFIRFFNAALEKGLYFAPSPFEAGFISMVHTPEIMADVKSALEEIFNILD